MPLQATSGAASYDAFGGGVPVVPKYIEDAFSCFLYSGTSANQIITNGINLSTDGGLVWIKRRSSVTAHALFDTNRGVQKYLQSNTTDAEGTASTSLTAFFTDGFRVGADSLVNEAGETYVSWTLKQQPKFFDVQTWTGNGSTAFRYINHNLGTTPKCIIIKRTDTTSNWVVWLNDGTTDHIAFLNTTAAADGSNGSNGYAFAASVLNGNNQFILDTVGGSVTASNASGGTYVAYLFAHNAGGFGLSGTDNVISCGGFTKSGSSDVTVNLGFEPQWILMKSSSNTQNWFIFDTMRGMSWSAGADYLNPNTSSAETPLGPTFLISATGFTMQGMIANASYIYIAIRRGPMKVPTTGTSVFAPAVSAGSTGTKITTDFPVDLQFSHSRSFSDIWWWADRLRGMNSPGLSSNSPYLSSNNTNTEATSPGVTNAWDNNSFSLGSAFSGQAQAYFNLRRAPGFFDEVCYTGNGSTQTITHNLGVVPELIIGKRRDADSSTGWIVYASPLANASTSFLVLNLTDAVGTGNTIIWNSTAPTSTVFSLGASSNLNTSGSTNVAYLFASCPGVSKVFNYTGNGSSQTINCGFTGGARFVLIKRTDSTGDWYVWDSARGIVSGNDPRLSLNTTAAEVTTDDSVDTDSTGFVVNQLSATNINVSSATYIGIAIA